MNGGLLLAASALAATMIGVDAMVHANDHGIEGPSLESVQRACDLGFIADVPVDSLKAQTVHNLFTECRRQIEICGAACNSYAGVYKSAGEVLRDLERKYADELNN